MNLAFLCRLWKSFLRDTLRCENERKTLEKPKKKNWSEKLAAVLLDAKQNHKCAPNWFSFVCLLKKFYFRILRGAVFLTFIYKWRADIAANCILPTISSSFRKQLRICRTIYLNEVHSACCCCFWCCEGVVCPLLTVSRPGQRKIPRESYAEIIIQPKVWIILLSY